MRMIVAVLLVAAMMLAPRASADPNALWTITHDQCVPNQEQHGDPAPCALVDLTGRYVVLKDLVGATQFLLIPTDRVSGIESPEILAPDAPDYFAAAWRARTFVEQRAGQPISRDWISLAINSAADRTQNQLHIHVDCVRADVREALQRNISGIGPDWAPLPEPLVGQQYRAMTLAGDDLTANPFQLLARQTADMGAETLVAVGVHLADGSPGFVLLANRISPAHGEDLQDHDACPGPGK
jgi:CDP-diacylglycerol pyrophosphatase